MIHRQLYRPDEVAKRYDVGKRTVLNWICNGTIPSEDIVKVNNRIIRIRPSGLEKIDNKFKEKE